MVGPLVSVYRRLLASWAHQPRLVSLFFFIHRGISLDTLAGRQTTQGYDNEQLLNPLNKKPCRPPLTKSTGFGKGGIMRLGEVPTVSVGAIETGSLSLDLAIGVGGVPRGRIIGVRP